MLQILRLPSSSVFTCYYFSSNFYETTNVCTRCLQNRRNIKTTRIEHTSFKPALFRAWIRIRKPGFAAKKIKETELLKVTKTRTTQTTMHIGKLNASRVTAFAEEPGMILKNLRVSKSAKYPRRDTVVSEQYNKSCSNSYEKFSSIGLHESYNLYSNNIYSHGKTNKRNNTCRKNSVGKQSLKGHSNNFNFTRNGISDSNRQANDAPSDLNIQNVKNLKEFEKLAMQRIYNTGDKFSPDRNIGTFNNSAVFSQEKKLQNFINEMKNLTEDIKDKSCFKTVEDSKEAGRTPDLHTHFNVEHAVIDRSEYFNKAIFSFVDVCVNSGLLDIAYRQLQGKRAKSRTLKNPKIYNIVLQGYSKEGNWSKVQDIIQKMEKNEAVFNYQTYAIYLDCLARVSDPEKRNKTYRILQRLTKQGLKTSDLFANTILTSLERENILKMIRSVIPNFEIASSYINLNSTCPLTANLYSEHYGLKSPLPPFSIKKMHELVEEQLSLEEEVICTVEKVASYEKNDPVYVEIWSRLTEMWRENLLKTFDAHLKAMKVETERGHCRLTIYPYLVSLPPETFVDIMIHEIDRLTFTSDGYSPCTAFLYEGMGRRIWHWYTVRKKIKNGGLLRKIGNFIKKYSEWCIHPSGPARNTRQKWQMMSQDYIDIAAIGERNYMWPESVNKAIGKFIYAIIFKSTLIPPEVLPYSCKKREVPAFYLVLRYKGGILTEELKCHPLMNKLYQKANVNTLVFDVDQLPMVCPPKPWTTVDNGGYYFLPTDFLRYTAYNTNMRELRTVPNQQLYSVFDSLNQLQSVPWVINDRVLDVALQIFKEGGSIELNVPVNPGKSDLPHSTDVAKVGMSMKARREAYIERIRFIKSRNNAYGLWCEAVYKLSLANHFRNKIIWLPQNLDFRGRVYPVPPHVNHITGDLYRSLLSFAKKECLGERGLDWLKIHAINLTGLCKKKPISDRLAFANEILSEIIDSAENPLSGNRWWTMSEEPWQTLAVCIEISNALKSSNPAQYRSGFPVHQDGSCNGLQHYAALGRDAFGAASVNLKPCDEPQDVYSVVTNIIERSRKKDAQAGLEIAKVLDGFVTRKVVKQTVMTTVYGVTRFGARLQIAGQLEGEVRIEDIALKIQCIREFPEDKVWEAAAYLTNKIFGGLQRMFTSAKEIQDWFIKCATAISDDCRDNVSWVTPLGLPVTQPYFREVVKDQSVLIIPDTRKQKNAFPPNFIHSLDSTHMMLTALFCERAGITFASVHDCFWTHPCTVDIMNRICREQFIALHSQNILNDLSSHFMKRYDSPRNNLIFSAVPRTGDFDLNSVMESVYFFC